MPGHRDWLKKAHGEGKAARMLIQDNEILDIAAFHTHQCAEKALKGYLVFKRKQIPKTHNLEDLIAESIKLDQAFVGLLHDAIILDPYVLTTRYPNDYFSIDEEEVQKAIEHAERIFNFVKTYI